MLEGKNEVTNDLGLVLLVSLEHTIKPVGYD